MISQKIQTLRKERKIVVGIVLDIILVAIVVVSVVYGVRNGFFKSLASFVSGIAALLCAYTFTPMLSLFIQEKFIINNVTESIAKTLASVAEAGKTAEGAILYDLSKLLENSQFSSIAERAGLVPEKVLEGVQGTDYGAVEAAARAVAEPLSRAVAETVAFIAVFILSFAILRLLTHFVGLVFKLPVLKEIDKTLGLVFGAVSALFFVWVFAMTADSLVTALSGIAPSLFTSEMIESSVLCEIFVDLNPISLLEELFKTNA